MFSVILISVLGVQSPPAQAITIKAVKTFDNYKTIAVAAAPTGARFAAALEDGSVKVFDAAKQLGVLTLTGHPQPVYALAFNAKGTEIATGDESARIWIWDAKTGKKLMEFPRSGGHTKGIQALSFSPDGKLLASTGKDDVIRIWDIATMHTVKTLLGKGANFYGGQYISPTLFAAATLSDGARLYNAKDFTPIKALGGHGKQGVLDICSNPTGTALITGGKDATATVWNVKQRIQAGILKGHQDWVIRTALSPNGKIAATSSSDRNVMIWDLKTYQPIQTIANESAVGSPLAFTRDGKYLITTTVNDALTINSVTPAQGGAAVVEKKAKRKRR